MKKTLCFFFLILCVNGLAQQKDLLRKKLLKAVYYYSDVYLPYAKNGDTLLFEKSKIRHVAFKKNHKIVVKEFISTYDGKKELEYKTKGRWNTTNGIKQFLILDFPESKIELELMSDKNDYLKFIVRNRERKQ